MPPRPHFAGSGPEPHNRRMPDPKIAAYMAAIVVELGESKKQVEEALALIETIDSRADPQPAKLLALRRYLRLGGAKVVAQWAWTAEETLAKSKEGTTKLLYDEAAKVQTKFAEQNVGCSLAVSPLRDLRKQVGLWNKNNTIQQAGEKLVKDMQTVLKGASYPDTPTPVSTANFKKKLQFAAVTPEPTSAAPGLSDHGQARAVDFVVSKNGAVVATTESATVSRVWRGKEQWEAKLIKAVKDSGAKLKGPLPKPDEPWHWHL